MQRIDLDARLALMPQLAAQLSGLNADLSKVLCIVPNDFLIPQLLARMITMI